MPINYLLSGNIKEFFLRLLFILPALIIGNSFHEAAHAWMANKMGDPTAKNLGRVTLDPIKHIDLWGFLSFALLGFGWGKPVPTNPRNYINYKKANVLVALSGVTVNLCISLFFMIVLAVLTMSGVFPSMAPIFYDISGGGMGLYMYGGALGVVHIILYYIAYLNLLLCFFNLLPVPPLDGHHLVKGFIARKSMNFYLAYERYGFMVLLFLLFMVPQFRDLLWGLVDLVFKGIANIFGVSYFTYG